MNDSQIPAVDPRELGDDASVVDVRSRKGGMQIRGALQYDAHLLLEAGELALPLPHDRPIAVYGDSEQVVGDVVRRLRLSGYDGAAALTGGIDAWRAAGLPTEESTQEQPIPGEPRAGIRRL